MASQYFAILTDYGTRAIAHALSQGQPLQLTQFAVGDGNGQAVTPTASATALVHQTHIAPVSAVSLDPRNNKQVIVELTIPENVGGFYIREMGVFDAQNKLIAYANCPESFKPTESSGSGKVQVLRMILKVESSHAVTLSIDNSVVFVTRQQMTPKTITATTQNGFDESGHSHEIAKASTKQQGITQLYSGYESESEDMAATPKSIKLLKAFIDALTRNLSNYIPNSKKSSAVDSNSADIVATSAAVKTAYDLANGKQSPATTLAGYGIGDLKIQSFAGDINTLKIDGIYAITQAGRSQNLPVSTSCHIQVIAGGDDSWCRQLAYVAYSTDMYERHQTSYQTDSWSAWVKIDGVDKLSKTDLVGEVAFFARQSPPSGWLKANGAAVSRTTYADLFAAIGTTFGAGDGRTTFNLPDLRGEFVRGLDDGRNVDGGRRLGAVQGDAIRNITGVFDTSKGSWAQQFVDFAEASGAFDLIKGNKQWTGDPNNGGNNLPTGFKFDASRVVPTANENRPRNIALLACIKY